MINKSRLTHLKCIITFARLKEFYEKYPDVESSLRSWNKSPFSQPKFAELRETFSSADQVNKLTVFNIGRNKVSTYYLY